MNVMLHESCFTDEFQRYLIALCLGEQLKRSGRNPKRVGADFHLKLALNRRRGEEDDDDW